MKLTNLGSFCLIFLYAKHARESEKRTTLRPPCWILSWQARLLNVRCLATVIQDQPPMAWTRSLDSRNSTIVSNLLCKQKIINFNFIPQINKEKKRKKATARVQKDYLLFERVFSPKALWQETKSWSLQKPTVKTVSTTRRTLNECGVISKQISAKQNIVSTQISYQFLARNFPVLRRNRATNSTTSNLHFPAAMKTLVFGNLSKLFRFTITFPRVVCHWG